MNDLEFRRLALSNPYDHQLDTAATAHPKRQQLLNEVRQQEAQLQMAMAVPTPPNLSQRLILNQTLKDFEQRQKRRSRWQIALAASVAFVAGTLFSFTSVDHSSLGFGQHALAHVYHEYDTMTSMDEKATLATFNSKLASYGGQLTGDIGHIYFVNYCDFEGVKSLHAVIKGEKGRVTVFIIKTPQEKLRQEQAFFADGKLDGMAEQIGKHQLILIGHKGEPLQETEQKLKSRLHWST